MSLETSPENTHPTQCGQVHGVLKNNCYLTDSDASCNPNLSTRAPFQGRRRAPHHKLWHNCHQNCSVLRRTASLIKGGRCCDKEKRSDAVYNWSRQLLPWSSPPLLIFSTALWIQPSWCDTGVTRSVLKHNIGTVNNTALGALKIFFSPASSCSDCDPLSLDRWSVTDSS